METQNQVVNGVSGTESPMFASFKAEKKISFIRPYDPKVQAVTGFRNSVIRYRETKEGTKTVAAKPAKMVTIPQLILPTDDYLLPEKAAQVLVGVLEDQQDVVIKELIESGASLINWDDLSIDKMLDSLTAVRVSARLTKEQIEGWARIALKEACTARANEISQAKGYDELQTLQQRAGTLNRYVAEFSKLSAPVPNIGQEVATSLQNMLTVANLDDDISKVLAAKLHAILHPVIADTGDL